MMANYDRKSSLFLFGMQSVATVDVLRISNTELVLELFILQN